MYHFIGIKGTGMSALAQIINDLGYEVQGSDKTDYFFMQEGLEARGIKMLPWDKNNIKKGMTIVQGNAFSDDHEEVIRAKMLGLNIYTYQQMVARLTRLFKTIGISGCHGKTTTTAMMSHVLEGITGANYLIGDGTGKASKDNDYFALEACEYKRHFLDYDPYYAIITNIELDHIDYYKDINDVIDAYQAYANKAEKMVIACGDDPYTRLLEVKKPIFYYGLSEDNDIIAKDVEYHDNGTKFEVWIEDNYYGKFDLPLYGKHMLLNALAVIAVCYYERLEAKAVANNLKTFKGAKKRFSETIIEDIVSIEDYAHHPTEVKVTIKGAKHKYPNKKIVAVLLIHTLSRAKEMAKEFADALSLADVKAVMDIYTDRKETGYDDVNYHVVTDLLDDVIYFGNVKDEDDVKKDAAKLLEYDNAVILFMSSKEIGLLKKEYEKQLKAKKGIE